MKHLIILIILFTYVVSYGQVPFTTLVTDVNVRVINIAGQKVFEKVYRQNNQIELDLTGNTAGIYLVNVIIGEEQFIKKIILKNR